MHRGVTRKWRPPLILVLGGVLTAVLGLPLIGVVVLRYLQGPFGYRYAALLVMVAVAVATLLLGYLLWRLLFYPITALAASARAVQSGAQLSQTAPLQYGTQELGDLGQSVLGMARSLQTREATIRSFADHVTHEMKTPLTAIRAASELLGDSRLDTADAQLVASIAASAAQMQSGLTALQTIAAARAPSHQGSCTLDQLTEGLQQDYPDLSILVSGADAAVPLASSGMRVVLGHLLRNAAEHGAQKVLISVQIQTNKILVSVQDDGAGITPGNRARIFDPFFSTRRYVGGTGMGLAIAQAVLSAHGASIALLPGPVTLFQIEFADDLSSGPI